MAQQFHKVSGTLKGFGERGWDNGAESADRLVAAPLTKGSATGEGVNQPGRRQEDDVNPVVAPPLVSRSSRGNAQGNSPGHNADAVVAYGLNTNRGGNADMCMEEELAPPVTGSHGNPGGVMQVGVRRLTPTECERLQGFDDGWTQLGETPDSRRYSALGDAVTVNVSKWIGRRLAA